MTLGVQMFTLRRFTQKEATLAPALARIAEIGYSAIQVSAFGPIPIKTVRRHCDSVGLKVTATHTPWQRLLEETPTVIQEHESLDCRHTAVGMIPPADYLSLAGLAQFLREAEGVARALSDAGITFSYHHHNHEFRWFEGKPWLEHLRLQAPALGIGIELDTHWVVAGGGDPADWIDRVGDNMPLLHLKDFVINDQNRRAFAAIGQGNLNWTEILSAAARWPIEHYFVEQDDCYGEDEFLCLQQSYDFLAQRGLG